MQQPAWQAGQAPGHPGSDRSSYGWAFAPGQEAYGQPAASLNTLFDNPDPLPHGQAWPAGQRADDQRHPDSGWSGRGRAHTPSQEVDGPAAGQSSGSNAFFDTLSPLQHGPRDFDLNTPQPSVDFFGDFGSQGSAQQYSGQGLDLNTPLASVDTFSGLGRWTPRNATVANGLT
jgi:hypothetical protein